MNTSTYSGGSILLRSTSLRKSLCRVCSAVQRLLGSSVSMWSSKSSAAEGMLWKGRERKQVHNDPTVLKPVTLHQRSPNFQFHEKLWKGGWKVAK